MKKIVSAILVSAAVLALLTGCSRGSSLSLGFGVYASASASDATEDKAGQGQAVLTAASVLVDDAGRIVKAFIDCADHTVRYTADGRASVNDSFTTKYEAGAAYDMVEYGGAAMEWYEQADAFCTLIVGKTAEQVKALVAEGNKGTDEVIRAGCTIDIAGFVNAVGKAIANAAPCDASSSDTLKLGISTVQTTADAAEDKPGSGKLETTFFAAAVNDSGKITAAVSDCVDVTFGFDTAGKSTFEGTKAVLSKREQGDGYGMKAYGGAAMEWYEQAAAFDTACIGKTAGEIEALMSADSSGNADLQAAGCTIDVSGFVKAAAKLAD